MAGTGVSRVLILQPFELGWIPKSHS